MQVALLLRCGISLSEAVLKQLEEAPLLWKALKKKMFYRRAWPFRFPAACIVGVGVQGSRGAGGSRCRTCSRAEAVEIRRKSDAFQQRVEDFRAFFLQAAPFAIAELELSMQHVRWPSAHAHGMSDAAMS